MSLQRPDGQNKSLKTLLRNIPAEETAAGAGSLKDEDFAIVVAGRPGVWMGLLQSAGGFSNYFVTREIKLPKNRDSLKAKYGTMVPTYVKY